MAATIRGENCFFFILIVKRTMLDWLCSSCSEAESSPHPSLEGCGEVMTLFQSTSAPETQRQNFCRGRSAGAVGRAGARVAEHAVSCRLATADERRRLF